MPISRDGIIGEKVVSGTAGRTFNHFEGHVVENPDGTRTIRIRFDEADIFVFADGTTYSKQRDTALTVALDPPGREFFIYNLRTGTPTATSRTYGDVNRWLQSLYMDAVATQVAP